MMGGEMYCDGGIVASNPAAVAVHEARSIFPDIPIEMVVSVGTGGTFIFRSRVPIAVSLVWNFLCAFSPRTFLHDAVQ